MAGSPILLLFFFLFSPLPGSATAPYKSLSLGQFTWPSPSLVVVVAVSVAPDSHSLHPTQSPYRPSITLSPPASSTLSYSSRSVRFNPQSVTILIHLSPVASSFRFYTMSGTTPKPRAEVIFSSDVKNMDAWARRTKIPLTTADALGATYARAHKWFQSLHLQLAKEHSWTDIPNTDPRMLFMLETSSIWRSSVGLPAGPKLRLQLPVNATSFFSPERRVQWEMVFHSDIFESVRKICPPINDILNLIQCLLTGVVTVAFEEHLPQGVYRTTRGLPPISWINANEETLLEIFGPAHFKALRKACSDTESAFRLEIIPHQR